MASLQNSEPLQANRVQFLRQRIDVLTWNIHDQQILHIGGANVAVGKAIRKIGRGAHLVRGNASAQNG
jgi:hypothetical protein